MDFEASTNFQDFNANEFTLQFIEEYRQRPILWDNTNKYYTNKQKRLDELNDMARIFLMSVTNIKQKIKSLRSYFAKERQKELKILRSSGSCDSFKSTWFAYDALRFIADFSMPSQTNDYILIETEESTHQDNLSNSLENEDTQESSEEIEKKPRYTDRNTQAIRRNLKRNIHDAKMDEAYTMKKMPQNIFTDTARDEWKTFGCFITDNVRVLNPRNQLRAKRQITQLLFDLQEEEMQTVN